ncbi:MAG: IS4 family transposase [Luteolibacter sp.]
MAGELEAAGLAFPASVLRGIRARIKQDGGLTRTELSREVCRWMNWRAANGELREMTCRLALLDLDRRGEVALPPKRSKTRTQMPAQRWEGISDRLLRCELGELGKIELVGVRATDDRDLSELWNLLISGYHYLGYTPLVGAQQRYLIRSEHHGVVGALGFSAAARRVAARDRWIGWSDTARAQNLHLVVSNSRFLILPWINVRNLASHVLGMASHRVVADWKRRYGYEPVLLESFVEKERFTGVSYRAANWVELGDTSGRGRQDRKRANTVSVKKILVYPLHQHWREKLGVLPAEQSGDWAERELGKARLGDKRLTERFVSVARDFYSHPQATIPQACNGDRAKVKAVYRFLDNQEVSLEKLLEPHRERTRQRIAEHPVVLCAQDTTSLNYTNLSQTEGLGPIGTRQSRATGLLLHDTVAVTPDGLALGVLDAQVWGRDWEDKEIGRDIEQKESVKWLRSYREVARLQAQLKRTRLVSVGDRESDIYELFATAKEHIEAGGPHLLVRSSENRRLADSSRKLWEKVEAEPVAGYRTVQIPARAGRKQRTAELSVRFREVLLSAPQGKSALGNIKLWAVHAREPRVPDGVEAVEWMLLTSIEVSTFDQACEKLDWYIQRWMIEVFHRTLKSGCRIEDRQLGNVKRLQNCLAIDMMVAVRIMHLTWLGRTQPDKPCTIYFEDHQWKALSCFISKKPVPQSNVPTIAVVVGWIGKLGGHLGRKSDRPPGTQALWEGLQRADDIIETVKLFTNFKNGP